jgi:NTE family protein
MHDAIESEGIRVEEIAVKVPRGAGEPPARERTVVVVAGAGARGAYEAGVMAELLPALSIDLKSTILLGTSAGAINVALWAARCHLGGLGEIGEQVKGVWQDIDQSKVFTQPAWSTLWLAFRAGRRVLRSSGRSLLQLLASPLGLGPPRRRESDEITALLDTAPLWDTAEKVVDFPQIRRNIAEGKLLGVGVVATHCPMDSSGGRSRVFLDANFEQVALPQAEPDSSIDYVGTDGLEAQHVLASAAIPIAFPPVEIDRPADFAGWYTDGGVRLNAPIEPAIKLGATRIIVISSHATEYPPAGARKRGRRATPDILDVGAQAVHAVLADGMIEDLKQLERINAAVKSCPPGEQRKAGTGRDYKHVEVLTVSPANGVISPLARKALGKLSLWQKPRYAFLSSLLSSAAGGAGSNELLSYLLFEPGYFKSQFKLGAASAQKALAEHRARASVT